ncbi:MAG TPA: hypothetical protein VG294_12070 [Solirubrobacteraceae bacterium]|jgi:hypothetical protein|nr:hypothetical protein [Solirubrobacteraceae bacterium]
MAAASLQPAEVAEAAPAVGALMTRMERNRRRRLVAYGFDSRMAHPLSDLHTPNLM